METEELKAIKLCFESAEAGAGENPAADRLVACSDNPPSLPAPEPKRKKTRSDRLMATAPTAWLSIVDLEARLRIERSTIYRMIVRGEFPPPTKFGNWSVWAIAAIVDFERRKLAERQSRARAVSPSSTLCRMRREPVKWRRNTLCSRGRPRLKQICCGTSCFANLKWNAGRNCRSDCGSDGRNIFQNFARDCNRAAFLNVAKLSQSDDRYNFAFPGRQSPRLCRSAGSARAGVVTYGRRKSPPKSAPRSKRDDGTKGGGPCDHRS